MTHSHWSSFLQMPEIYMRDLPSVLVHAVISKLDDYFLKKTKNQNGNDSVVYHLLSGFGYTIRQDYAFALINKEPEVDDDDEGVGEQGVRNLFSAKNLRNTLYSMPSLRSSGLADDQRALNTRNRIANDLSKKPGTRSY